MHTTWKTADSLFKLVVGVIAVVEILVILGETNDWQGMAKAFEDLTSRGEVMDQWRITPPFTLRGNQPRRG